jgi:hypothetical protein
MCLWENYMKKYEKLYFFASLKSIKKGFGSNVRSGSGAGSTTQEVRIRTKMSRVPNTTVRSS